MKLIMENWNKFVDHTTAEDKVKKLISDSIPAYLGQNPGAAAEDISLQSIIDFIVAGKKDKSPGYDQHMDLDMVNATDFLGASEDGQLPNKTISSIFNAADLAAIKRVPTDSQSPDTTGNWRNNEPQLYEDDDTPSDPARDLDADLYHDPEWNPRDSGYPPEETQAAAIKRANRGK